MKNWNTSWQIERESGISNKELFRMVLEGKISYKKSHKKGFLFNPEDLNTDEANKPESEYLNFIEKYSNLLKSHFSRQELWSHENFKCDAEILNS